MAKLLIYCDYCINNGTKKASLYQFAQKELVWQPVYAPGGKWAVELKGAEIARLNDEPETTQADCGFQANLLKDALSEEIKGELHAT